MSAKDIFRFIFCMVLPTFTGLILAMIVPGEFKLHVAVGVTLIMYAVACEVI